MTDQKKTAPSRILWVDLEMTGLEPTKDRIIEVAAIMTDWDFTELGRYESGVGQNEQEVTSLFAANAWASARPEETKELINLSLKSPSEQEVQAQLLAFIDQHVPQGEVALLAGNSIHCDRGFIKQWWSHIDQRLHYRMLDVSAWKVVMQAKFGMEFAKKETHRALDDIEESISELQYYLRATKL
jgi:oligoribonuclease